MKDAPTAMILAAGLGTRLKPLTNSKPKALMEYRGKTLLETVIQNLSEAGFKKIIVNVHHFGDQVIQFISKIEKQYSKIEISDERDLLLDTGGGLKKACSLFGSSPVLIHNVDIITNMDLKKFYDFHLQKKGLATLAVKKRNTSRSLLMNENHLLCGWRNNSTGEEIIARPGQQLEPIAFSGIYVVEPEFCNYLQGEGSFPVMPEILNIARTKEILLYPHNEDSWKDMGKKESYQD